MQEKENAKGKSIALTVLGHTSNNSDRYEKLCKVPCTHIKQEARQQILQLLGKPNRVFSTKSSIF